MNVPTVGVVSDELGTPLLNEPVKELNASSNIDWFPLTNGTGHKFQYGSFVNKSDAKV
jgi:hypothetical protein